MTDSKFRVRQQLIDHVKQLSTKTPRRFALITMRTFEDFKKFLAKINPDNFDYQGHFILVLIHGSIPEIQEIFDNLWKLQVYNVIVIFEDDHEHLSVVTFFPFRSSTDCSNTTPVLINEFINGTFTRDLTNIFPNKMENLQQCKVRVATSDHLPPHIYTKTMIDGSKRLAGRDFELINALSETLNFKIVFSFYEALGCFLTNNSAPTSALQNKSDVVIVNCYLRLKRLEVFDASTTYFTDKAVVLFPHESDLSSFEKLFYPLTLEAWIYLVVYLIIGIAVIFVISRQSKTIQNFVFGRNVKNPYINMLLGMLGTSQHLSPGNNFSRFLLMNFLIFAMIIRTVYQGKLFHVMQANLKYSEPQTIVEMLDRGYKLHIAEAFIALINNDARVKVIKNFYALKAMNQKIETLNAAGLIQYWYSLSFMQDFSSHKENPPKTLTFDHLSGCFEIWAGGCLVDGDKSHQNMVVSRLHA
ncbi:ionotropic receptor 21a-like [Chironomus tepperi]|uniref:ionotropic receptor 21a-like n=1 Tax=Chironomus tepperi TaxID=113505 RepID=UPI00391F5317